MLQIAAGILIATLPLGIVAAGLSIAGDRDLIDLGETWKGWSLAGVGAALALGIIYVAHASA